MLPKQPNHSLIDGLTCLQELAGSGESVGVRQMARQLSMEPTRVHRLLKTLAHLGLAEQTENARYQVGPGIHVLAAMSLFGSGMLKRALGPLESLQRFQLVVAMGVLWRTQVSYLYHWRPGVTSAEAIGRVGLYPATRSGLGMVLLAQLSKPEIETLYRDQEIAGYPGATGVAALWRDLRIVEKKGYGEVLRENHENTLAVWVGGASGNGGGGANKALAAIGVAGVYPPAQRSELLKALRVAARAITTESKVHKGSQT